ncbi:MAG TPA: hypothetical protein VMO26_02260 [Vicinamibacterales bacterium]|nr:hypothetical protein [Vicinamibacterales bacterium]
MTRRDLIAAVTALVVMRGHMAASQEKPPESKTETVTLVISGMT